MKILYVTQPYVSFVRAATAYRDCLARLGHEVVERPGPADLVVLHGEPRLFPDVMERCRAARGARRVGYVVCELTAVGARHRAGLDLLDEVWTASPFCREVLARVHPNVHVVPHAVVPPVRDDAALAAVRAAIGGPDEAFRFYAVTRPADGRKNLAAALRAFGRLRGRRPLRFVVKAVAGTTVPGLVQPGVVALGGDWPAARIDALHALCHAHVSPHRAEGWGMGLAEAMAAGRLAVATGYSGNLAFMTERNSLLLPWRPVAVPERERLRHALEPGEAPGLTWADPDPEALAAAMARCVAEWDALAPLRARAGQDMQRFSPGAVAAILARRIAAWGG